jgi:hypothetical protein
MWTLGINGEFHDTSAARTLPRDPDQTSIGESGCRDAVVDSVVNAFSATVDDPAQQRDLGLGQGLSLCHGSPLPITFV